MSTVMQMSLSASALAARVRQVVEVIDRAHAAGLAIPSKATEAVEALAALSVCWDANARGRPAPDTAKAALGLLPPEEVNAP